MANNPIELSSNKSNNRNTNALIKVANVTIVTSYPVLHNYQKMGQMAHQVLLYHTIPFRITTFFVQKIVETFRLYNLCIVGRTRSSHDSNTLCER